MNYKIVNKRYENKNKKNKSRSLPIINQKGKK